ERSVVERRVAGWRAEPVRTDVDDLRRRLRAAAPDGGAAHRGGAARGARGPGGENAVGENRAGYAAAGLHPLSALKGRYAGVVDASHDSTRDAVGPAGADSDIQPLHRSHHDYVRSASLRA